MCNSWLQPQYAIDNGDTRADRESGEGTKRMLHVYDLEDVCEALDMRPSEVRAMAGADLADELGYGGGRYYSGPGRSFSHGAFAGVQRRRVVVRQTHALDI